MFPLSFPAYPKGYCMRPFFRRFAVLLKAFLLFACLSVCPVHAQDLEAESANGDASAQFLLGMTYLDGTRITKNDKMAEKWLLLAAEQGHQQAQYMLASLYTEGKAFKCDYKKAFYWGKILADKGHRLAQYGISVLYENGLGVEKDPVLARRWLESAVALGSPSAIAHLDALDSATQVREISDPARYPEILKKADAGNDATAQYWIGHAYLTGHGLKKDTDKAWVWLRRSANQGNAFAQYDLSYLYPLGEGIRPEYQMAVLLVQRAAASGHVKAIFNLGGMYETGVGLVQNWNQAYQIYIMAARVGNANAIARLRAMEVICQQNTIPQCDGFVPDTAAAYADVVSLYRIALTLFDGDGITQSYGQSLRWFQLAADKGHALSQYQMGQIYQNGLGLDRDRNMARYWYQVAAQNGNPDAIRHMQTGK